MYFIYIYTHIDVCVYIYKILRIRKRILYDAGIMGSHIANSI